MRQKNRHFNAVKDGKQQAPWRAIVYIYNILLFVSFISANSI